LSTFFSRTKKIRALWFPIILESTSSSSSSIKSREFGLHNLLGLDYDLYLSFMKECGLIYSFQHNKTRSTIVVPSVVKGRYNTAGYTWDDFLSEFHLSADVELSYICSRNGTKKYYLRVGKFSSSFTILEQQRKGLCNSRFKVGFGCRDEQKNFLLAIAQEVNLTLPVVPIFPTASSIIHNERSTISAAEPSFIRGGDDNFKMLLEVHFFDRVVKPGVNTTHLWDLIDVQKIREGLDSLLRAVQMHKAEEAKQRLSAIGEIEEDDPIELMNGVRETSFPVFNHYHIPLRSHVISALQRDLIKLSMSCQNTNLLSFKFYNDSICTLVHVPKSRTYSHFKRNAKRVKWIQDILAAATVNADQQNEAAEWLLQHLGENYHDCFIHAAESLGVLLTSKKMDAYSACAMWEEANVPLRAQRVILRHLANFFGQRITVPERDIRELEAGATPPISGSIVIGAETITFWHRDIDQAVLNRLQTEFKCRGKEYFQAMGYDSIDIIFGADHGARRFRAAIKIVFRNKCNAAVAPSSVVITIGNIDCKKETYEILAKTIAKPINEALKRIVGKFFVVHCNAGQCIATITDELPSNAGNCNNSFSFSTRTFTAGDLAIFH
jgi:ribosomal protein L35AE/L33A